MRFRLNYAVMNGGDGSANVEFFPTQAEAEKADEEQAEGWGESSACFVELEMVNGTLCYRTLNWDEDKKKYEWVLVPLEVID